MKQKNMKRILLSILVLVAGAAGMKLMINAKKEQTKRPAQHQGALVETVDLFSVEQQIEIKANGTVQARKMVELVPQVGGQVIDIAETFLAGAFFMEDDLLFKIDPTDYELALERARAREVSARFEMAKMEGQARVAQQEWSRMHPDGEQPENPLVLYGPQLESAKSALASAVAEVKQAELNLERTQVRAPFNCIVKSERVERGQLVLAGQSVASLRGTDRAELIIPVTYSDLSWLKVPRRGGSGSKALVKLGFNGHTRVWEGFIERSLGEVDPQGRMIRLVVTVPDPYGLEQQDAPAELFLAEGLFVDVTLIGKSIENAFEIPTAALREGEFVWIFDPAMKLNIRRVELIRNQGESVWVKGDIRSGEKLILTYVPGAVDGMPLREKQGGEQ